MGIDLHNLHFLAHAQDLGVRYDRTLAIGRQALYLEERDLAAHRARRGLPALHEPPRSAGAPRYFEPLARQWLGAQVADAVDASAYEGARLVHDMNLPWPAASPERGSYDAVLDFGCLEHVFDFPTAWRNCVDLCRVGGHVLHALPANNLSGHGFYQFSPELFFNLYQRSRGFALKALYFALKVDGRHWWRVADPMVVHRRVNLRNGQEVYMLVLAQKLAEPGRLPAVQQSDYAQQEWLRAAPAPVDARGGAQPERTRPTGTADEADMADTADIADIADTADIADLADTADTAESPDAVRVPRGGMNRMRRSASDRLAALGLIDAARRTRERLRGWRASGLTLPAPDYQRLVVADLLRPPRST